MKEIGLGKSDMFSQTGTKVTRQELWSRMYHSDRYMSGLSTAELNIRFADVLSNITTLDRNGKLAFDTNGEWLRKNSDLIDEFRLRGRTFPHASSIQDNILLPNADGLELALKAYEPFMNSSPKSFTLFKYGKAKYLRPLYEAGKLRISPATKYKDPSLNPAIRDNELELEKIVGDTRTTYRARSNFLCFCSSWFSNTRLVADFNADCILVVHNPQEFFLRIARALNRSEWKFEFNRVDYIDPLCLGHRRHIASLLHVKHFRYAYQCEHRLVILPPKPTMDISEVDVDIGPITDICTYYE